MMMVGVAVVVMMMKMMMMIIRTLLGNFWQLLVFRATFFVSSTFCSQ